MGIHRTAVIEEGAELGDVEVGPFAVIGAGAVLKDGVRVGAHAVIEGPTVIGAGTEVGSHAVLGGLPQDRKHDRSAPTRLVIGEGNVFREFTSAHRGSSEGRGETTIGDGNYFMANSHVAHDCVVGSGTMFANSAAVGGHVSVGDGVVLGGLAAVHQHCRVGRLAMIGGGAMCAQDVPPFAVAQGDRARLRGTNITGLTRAGVSAAAISAIKYAVRVLFVDDLPRNLALSKVRERHGDVPEVAELLAFLEASDRGVVRGPQG